jgi:glucosamine--fructose-6-phosphate aminotransferase (isomerizing)
LVPNFIREFWPGILQDAEEAIHPWIDQVEQIYLCGCGDSHHAAVGLEFAFDLWSGRNVRVAPAMYMSRYLIPRLTAPSGNTLVIGISSSGEVARTLEAINLANQVGAVTLAFTSNDESSLAQTARASLKIPAPSYPGPGLISYVSSLMKGYALCAALADPVICKEICLCMDELPRLLDEWIPVSMERGIKFAENPQIRKGCLFVAGGSLHGSALFAAAKIIESAGTYAWAQELEEWAHLEYFCNPAQMPTWFLTAGGRTKSREQELFQAARIIGREVNFDLWEGLGHWRQCAREALAPLGLWAGATSCAASLAQQLGEEPFRSFSGGRSHVEGGGASRIRSSFQFTSLRDFSD